jgi:hypothetical protein
LSAEGVDFALERCLEARPSEREIDALLRSTDEAPGAHVLLSSNVFVAAHRAIAIGLAASADVRVRPSRREPEMAELLLEGAPESFQVQAELEPRAGDHLWAYGSDETLRNVQRELASDVVLHAHGSGFGIALVAGRPSTPELEILLAKLAEDIALFDQRGCLSPRVLLVSAGPEFALEVARELAVRLEATEARIPRGRLDPQEAAEISAYRDAASYAGELFDAGRGFVSCHAQLVVPPIGRNLHVLPTSDALASVANLSSFVTSCASAGDAELASSLSRALPGVRICEFGQMQRPPFDGPVDRRTRQT